MSDAARRRRPTGRAGTRTPRRHAGRDIAGRIGDAAARVIPRLAAAVCALVAAAFAPAQVAVEVAAAPALAPIPDAIGRAGMAAVALRDDDGAAFVLAAGGANFPDGPPWQGGSKRFHADVFALSATAGASWRRVGALPHAVAYAGFAAAEGGLVVAGGADASSHLARTVLVRADGSVRELPPLPGPRAYAACANDGARLWLVGGQAAPTATTALADAVWLDLKDLTAGWRTLPLPAAARILAHAGVVDGELVVAGGCALAPDAAGGVRRRYLADGFALPIAAAVRGDARVRGIADLPTPLAAGAGPLLAREGGLLLLGGDDGSWLGKPPQDHPGQQTAAWTYDRRADRWTRVGALAEGIVTAPLVGLDARAVVVSGETKPGVRTPTTQALRVDHAVHLGAIDWLTLGLGGFALLAIAVSARRRPAPAAGRRRPLLDPARGPGRAGWLAVGLLFVVAMLNYLDRQLLAAMAEPILRDIPQSSAQFGLLTAVFLFVYSALSPVGGLLADRCGRSTVILVSLVVWSAVTWATGHVRDHRELLVARALMGVSEAFYIPAALALITDHHRGRTRSLATGLHMGGVYAGQAIAGLGGYAAEALGWRAAFAAFGLVGVCYALVLVVFLREADDGGDAATTRAPAADAPAKVSPPPDEAPLLRNRAFWLLFAVMGGASVSNWFVLSWLPRLLQERFALALGDAGALATLPSTLAKYAAVVLGALLADRLARTNPRGRSRLAACCFLVAGPAIAATTLLPAGALPAFVALVACQGIAQGVLDATLMPMLRQAIGGRLAATGYGCLNLVGAGVGGLTVLYGGALRDAGVPLDATLAASGAGLLLCGVALWALPATVRADD